MPEPAVVGGRFPGLLPGIVAIFLAGALGAPEPSRAAPPEEELVVARDFFRIANYAAALDLVRPLLRSGAFAPDDRLAALELEARCHVALGSRMEAVDSFCSALQQSPAWRPDPVAFTDPEREAFAKAFELCGPLDAPVPVVDPLPKDPLAVAPPDEGPAPPGSSRLRAEPGGRPWYRSPWLLGGVGGVIAGVAFLSFGEQDSPPPAPLPDFPPPPE